MNRMRARDNGIRSGARRRTDAKNRWEDAALELAKTLGRTATAKTIFDRLMEDGVECPWSMLERRISEWREDGTLPRPDRKKAT